MITVQNDAVHHPQQYTKGKIECLDYIMDQNFPFLAAQVVKYITRYRYKGKPVEDLQKARFYLDRLIAEEEKK